MPSSCPRQSQQPVWSHFQLEGQHWGCRHEAMLSAKVCKYWGVTTWPILTSTLGLADLDAFPELHAAAPGP
jgi:hypothetical protein